MNHFLLCLTLLLPAGPAGDETVAPEAAALAETLDQLCQPLVDGGVAVGLAVGVIQDGNTLVRGYGRLAKDDPAVPDGNTVYEIGSVSKVFTSLLLADQVQRGLVTLDDPVQKHLPDTVAMPTFEGDPVLLWHLATHTSGLPRMPSNFLPKDPMNPYADYTAENLYDNLPKLALADEPGAAMAYSNLGVGLLGHVLCRTAGADTYEQLLVERVCDPLDLQDTRIVLNPSMSERLAPPYNADGVPDHVWDLNVLAGAGGIRSTVNDMLLFANAQLHPDETPLGDAIRLTQEKRFDGPQPIGLGWLFAGDGITRWHNGQTGGYHSFLGVDPERGKAVVILCNSAITQPDTLGDRILKHLHGLAVEPLAVRAPVAVDAAVLKRYVGTYAMSPALKFTLTMQDDDLFAQLTGQSALRLYPSSETEFFYRVVDASITFEVAADGAVAALVLHQNGRDMRFAKEAT